MLAHLGPGIVEDQLIPLQLELALRLLNRPFGMLFKQFTFGIHHLRLDPDPKPQTSFDRRLGQRVEAFRKAFAVRFPVAEPSLVVDARILIAEPSVIEQEQFHTNLFGRTVQLKNPIKVEIKAGGLPVIQQRGARCVPITDTEVASPGMKLATHVAQAVVAPGPNHGGGGKRNASLNVVGRRIWIDTRQSAHATACVLECHLITTRPGERSGKHTA